MTLLDARGEPLPPIDQASHAAECQVEAALLASVEREMHRKVSEAIFGTAPEERVRLLRESVFGPQPGGRLQGLAAALSGPGFRER